MRSFVVTEHIHLLRMLRRERVLEKQRRLPRQTQVHEHGGEHDMRRLSRWVDQRWSEGLHRCFVCARLRVLGVGMRHLVTTHMHLIFICVVRQTWTSAWKTTVVATANASARIRRAVMNAANVQLVGLMMERQTAKVCVRG